MMAFLSMLRSEASIEKGSRWFSNFEKQSLIALGVQTGEDTNGSLRLKSHEDIEANFKPPKLKGYFVLISGLLTTWLMGYWLAHTSYLTILVGHSYGVRL